MKKIVIVSLISILILALGETASATFDSGSTGADGAFNPTANIQVVLPPDGVLNYTTINIPSGVSVTFQKNDDNTPVYMLATGDVTIAGTINVTAGNGTSTVPGQGGPGGYKGGFAATVFNTPGGKGLGPGGGNPGLTQNRCGGGGGFATAGETKCSGATGGATYGNERLLPLIGGSGGGGGSDYSGRNAGGGGGAIMIASSATITVSGAIYANGGSGNYVSSYAGGAGSGGAIKLVANVISGEGNIHALGYTTTLSMGSGGNGRIRIETFSMQRQSSTSPSYSLGQPSSIFIPDPPSLSITSVGGSPVPANAVALYNQPDISLPDTTTNPVPVDVSATNIPVGTTVKVWVIPQYGSSSNTSITLTGNDASSSGTANVNLSTSYSNILMAESTFTIMAFYWDGEEIEKVRLATQQGDSLKVVYLTKSGKEINGDEIASMIQRRLDNG